MGYAHARVGDRALASDIAQEAFTEAFLHLDQLRDPAAFPGWFRRVVHKHCDRHTRRVCPVSIEPVTVDTATAHDAVPATARLDAQREALWLRDAVEALPEHERVVMAMHYLGDCSQRDVADFLELPLTTVKKRLHVARGRLSRWQQESTTTEVGTTQPTPTEPAVRLFLAIRAGDQRSVGRIVGDKPELIAAEELWSDAEALESGLPLAHGQPPLVLAARMGDAAMVEFLMSWGAQVNQHCACKGAESPLWVAVRAGDAQTVDVLLRAGADPAATNAAGLTALHVAAMRGRVDLVERLLQHGADPDARDKEGTVAADRARAHGHADVLALLGAPRPTSPETRVHEAGERIETGIKALDLWVPLVRGSVIRVHGAAETGLMVLMSEIVRRFADRGGASVWATWERQPWHHKELETVAAEAGTDVCLRIVKATAEDSGEQRHSVVERALDLTADLARDHRPVALFVFEEPGHRAQLEAALPRLAQHAHVVFVVQPWSEVTKGVLKAPEVAAPYTGVLCTDPSLAKRDLYPAIDPQRSRSVACEGDTTAQRARALLDPSNAARPARRALLEAFMTEPFAVAEQATGWAAAPVSRRETHDSVLRILDGELDDVAEGALRYRSSIPADVRALAPSAFRCF